MRNLLKCSAVLLLSIPLFAQAAKKPVSKAVSAAKPASKTATTVKPDSKAAATAETASASKPAPKPATPAEAATSTKPASGAPTKALVDQFFKRTFGYDPNFQVRVLDITQSSIPDLYEATVRFITPDAQQTVHWYISKDQKHAIFGDMFPFGTDPFEQPRTELAKSAFGPTKGPADSKLVIVEFADLECPACKTVQPMVEKLRTDFPQARFVFQSYPLVRIHPWSVRSASFLDCIARTNQNQAFTFMESIFAHQKEIDAAVRNTDAEEKATIDETILTERMRHYTEAAGANPAKIQACADSPETAERIKRGQALAKSLNVIGTPAIFVNGRPLGIDPAQYDSLKMIVAFEAEHVGLGSKDSEEPKKK